MRICYLADGQSVHTARWCRHFASQGHDVHLITFRQTVLDGINVHHVDAGRLKTDGGNWRVLLKWKEVRRLVNYIGPDLLHAQYATSYGMVGALTGFHPYVVTALGSDVLVSPQRSWPLRRLLRYVFGRADWLTAMAHHMRDAMIRLGAPASKVTTIIFGIDPLVFNSAGRRPPENRFVITTTRNLEPVYNHDLFINALALVRENIPGLEVHVVGDGSQRRRLEWKAQNCGLADAVQFHGSVPQQKIAGLLKKTHLFVTVSLSDGNNVSLNEAMACGAIAVATDIPANRQWIQEGVNGFLVPVNDPSFLAQKILYVYHNYTAMENEAIMYNEKVIREKALWSENMRVVEARYNELVLMK